MAEIYLTVKEVSEILNTGIEYVEKQIELGSLEYAPKTDRIPLSVVMSFKKAIDMERSKTLDELALLGQELQPFDFVEAKIE